MHFASTGVLYISCFSSPPLGAGTRPEVFDTNAPVLCCAVPSVLCRAVLCCAVLCCAVLCCAALRCAALCCAVLCRALLCCAVPCHVVLSYAVLQSPRCSALCCKVQGADLCSAVTAQCLQGRSRVLQLGNLRPLTCFVQSKAEA